MSTVCVSCYSIFFFFNDTATTEIYTLSLHDALPIFVYRRGEDDFLLVVNAANTDKDFAWIASHARGQVEVINAKSLRSEEHTSELQSRLHLVCRLLLEKKK